MFYVILIDRFDIALRKAINNVIFFVIRRLSLIRLHSPKIIRHSSKKNLFTKSLLHLVSANE